MDPSPSAPSAADLAAKDREVFMKLRAPFHGDVISWRPGNLTKGDNPKAQALAYIDARDVQRRFEEALGWDWEVEHYGVGSDHVCCRVTITLPSGKKIARSNGAWVGNVEMAPTRDGKADQKEEDRVDREAKWALSDAFKRAASMFGVGTYLYDMPSPYMPLNQFKKFDDDALARLKDIAHKPYAEWQRKREADAKQRAAAPPTAQTQQGAPPAPQTPVTPPPAVDPPSDETVLTRLIRGARELQSVPDFNAFVARTKETFEKGTEEKRIFAEAIRAAAVRLGIQPKTAPQQQTGA